MKFEYYFLNNLIRTEALQYFDSGMEQTTFNSLFDKVVITNEGSNEGHMEKIKSSIPDAAEKHNVFYVSDDLKPLDLVHQNLNIRSIQFLHKDLTKKRAERNEAALLRGGRPDFIMMSYQSLPSIFSFAAVVDAEFIKSSGKPYRQLIAE